jgi:ribosomal-protein-alanine N-acetyltransferase
LEVNPTTAGAQFAIREYRANDFDRLWQIDQLCFPPGIAYSQMELTGFILQRNAITLVAESQTANANGDNGNLRASSPQFARVETGAEPILGFVVAHPRKKIGRILTLDILPEARRFGLGSRLMETCEQRLRSSGCKQVYLETAVSNQPALRLYRKLGYEILRTIPEYYPSHALDAFLMGKRL